MSTISLPHWSKLRLPEFLSRSLSVRIAVALAAVLVAILIVFATIVTLALRSELFELRKDTVLEDASVRFTQVQGLLDQTTASTPDQMQDTVTQMLTATNESAAGAGAVALMLLRSEDIDAVFGLNEYPSSVIQGVLTPEMKQAVANGFWQSVEVAGDDGNFPAIIVGGMINIPNAGDHEMYLLYSLQSEENTLLMVMQVLGAGFVPIVLIMTVVTLVLVYRQLRPVRSTARAVTELAEGDLESRVDVRGHDEMAQLGEAFNEMAASLESQITQYDQLSQFQQRFVSDVSHELRTPLTTIRMAEELIYDERSQLDPVAQRSAELLHSEVARFEEMLADLLEISRYDANSATLEMDTVDIGILVKKTVDANQELADHLGVEVRFTRQSESVSAEVDAKRIERVMRNLVINAYEHAERSPVEIDVASTNTAVSIRVRDYGVGMDSETIKRVFDRFFRADPARARTTGGTGLGLSIAREDIAIHNGTIDVWGERGRGACFVVTIPRREGVPAGKPALKANDAGETR